ncbi:CRTAC1 family protein [Luedemannella helvata]|uniref:CRTAC1 family protein n=1 Tax=Luedemannella helvata TaxID=349315 RepID=A0ABN2KWW0_9ACTN
MPSLPFSSELTRRLPAWIRAAVPAVTVILVAAGLYAVARRPEASDAARGEVAARFGFTELPIALPPGLPERTIREVNPSYEHIRAWISSVGAGIAVNDLDGNGRPDDLCLVDTRSDTVVVTPAPGTTPPRYAPFVLDPAPLPTNAAVAPMGCAPGEFNGDGRTDVLVYYWGRTPVVFLGRQAAGPLSPAAFRPTELVPTAPAPDGRYAGQLWNTNAVSIADFDGDGHPDIGVFNYFPDSQVLDPQGQPNVQMNHTMSRATNGGGAHLMRWIPTPSSPDGPTVRFVEDVGAIDPAAATGWTLGAGSADLDDDLLPELYVANDFGQDRMFHNVSQPGRIRFQLLAGKRYPYTPKSMVLGNDSFKSMSIDFGDLDNNGAFDMFVSNITTPWGLQESNFAWVNTTTTTAAARDTMSRGVAPFDNRASDLNVAWSGWGWDAKMADFDNSGDLAIVQTTGFVKGEINRWSWLQELAMSNDLMLKNPQMWPDVGPTDDIAGSHSLVFWARENNGRFANVSADLGLAARVPTRGIAVADTDGDGWQDFAVARQWGPPAFYRNDHPASGNFLGLRLHRPGQGSAVLPAYGAVVKITGADGRTQISQVDGGSGHSGKRSFDVFFGLGPATANVTAELSWRDTTGAVHRSTVTLAPGWHDILLDTQATEVAPR